MERSAVVPSETNMCWLLADSCKKRVVRASRRMKLVIPFLTIFCLEIHARGLSQTITLSVRETTLEKVFAEIKAQTGFVVVFSANQMKAARPVTITVDHVPLNVFLDLLMADQPLTYVIRKTTISIKDKTTEPTTTSSSNNIHLPPPITVHGRVLSENGEPLAGVSVMVKGTTMGIATDQHGKFSLTVPERSVLVFRSIGYKTVEIASSSDSMMISLQTERLSMNEVVVTALGIRSQAKSLSYATQKVDEKSFTEVRDAGNIINAFQGKIANATITQSSTALGGGSQLVIRGKRSIQGNNSALFVVDGVPQSYSLVNPDDIESINVLRGASSAALYGPAAANGVVVITTKKGKSGVVSVNVNSNTTIDAPFVLPFFQNTYGQGRQGEMNIGTISDPVGDNWGEKMTGQSYTNWKGEQSTYSPQPDNVADFFRKGVSTVNSISVTGGSEKAQTYLSYTNRNLQGFVPTNDLTDHNITFRLSNQISKRFSTDAKVTYLTQHIKNKPRDHEGDAAVFNIYQIPRNVSLNEIKDYEMLNNIGVPAPVTYPSAIPTLYGNPYWSVNRNTRSIKQTQILFLLGATYKITDWLSLKGRANINQDILKQDRKTFQYTPGAYYGDGGFFQIDNSTTKSNWFDLMLEGENHLTGNLKLNYNAGFIIKHDDYDALTNIADGLYIANRFSLNFANNRQYYVGGATTEIQSLFGRFNFSFKDAVYLEGTLRNDWSSVLAAPHSFQYYSAGISAVVSDLVKLPTFISFLKTKLNYAEVGNGGQFGLLSTVYNYSPGSGMGYLTRSSTLPIPGLKPEIVKNIEAGLDVRFLDNRFGLDLTVYKSNAINQLLVISLPEATGFANQYINAGNIQNKGVEAVLSATPIRNKDLTWDIDLNFGLNRNLVKELSDNLKTINLSDILNNGGQDRVTVGGSYGDIYAYSWVRHENGQFRVNEDGLPLTGQASGADPVKIGNYQPRATAGLNNSIRYKKINFRFLIDGRFGGTVVSGTEMNIAANGLTEVTALYREGNWNLHGVDEDGKEVNSTINAESFWTTVSQKRNGNGEFFAYDATNFRLRELSIGYELPVPVKSFIKAARINLVSRNLFWIYRGKSILSIPGIGKRKMWFDPDVTNANDNGFIGIEYGSFPSTRSIGLNLHLTF